MFNLWGTCFMKMPEKIEPSMIAPCGVNCLACSAHLDKKSHVSAVERRLKKSLEKVAGIVSKNDVPLNEVFNGALNAAASLVLE